MRSAISDLLRTRDYALLFAAQALSIFGSAVVPVAVTFAVLDLTGSATDLGIVLLGVMLPFLLFAGAGGVLGDRVRRERVLLLASLVACASQGLVAVLLLTGAAQLWHLFVLQLVLGGTLAVTGICLFGLIADVAPAHRLQEANALLSISRSAAGIAGPALAGLIIAVAEPGWAIALDSLSYGVAACAYLWIKPTPLPRPSSRRRLLRDLREGWSEFRSRDWLWTGVVYYAFLNVFVIAPLWVLGPVVAKESLGGAGAWATIMTAGGIGSVLAGLLALRLKPRRPLLTSFALYAAAAPEAALLAIKAPVLAIAAAALTAQLVLTFGSPVWTAMLQEKIPRKVFSRVQAYDVMGSFALLPFGFGLSGIAAAALGTHTVLWFSACWLVLSTTVLVSFPSIRRLRRDAPEEGDLIRVDGLAFAAAESPERA